MPTATDHVDAVPPMTAGPPRPPIGTTPILKWLGAAVLLVACVLAGRFLRRNLSDDGETSPTAAVVTATPRSELLYTVYCAKCHGPEGRGDGEGVEALARPPRDFRSTQWRFSRTAESIQRVIAEGIPGTPMPASGAALSRDDLRELSQHVLALSAAGPPVSAPSSDREVLLQAAGFSPTRPYAAAILELESVDQLQRDVTFGDGRMMLVHFWGTSCVHCLQEFPRLIELEQSLAKLGRPIEVLSICADEPDAEEAERLARPFAGEHRVYVDRTGLASHRYQVQALPYYCLVDGQGNVIADRLGSASWDAAAVGRALAELGGGHTGRKAAH